MHLLLRLLFAIRVNQKSEVVKKNIDSLYTKLEAIRGHYMWSPSPSWSWVFASRLAKQVGFSPLDIGEVLSNVRGN
jgi:hypothetical protein